MMIICFAHEGSGIEDSQPIVPILTNQETNARATPSISIPILNKTDIVLRSDSARDFNATAVPPTVAAELVPLKPQILVRTGVVGIENPAFHSFTIATDSSSPSDVSNTTKPERPSNSTSDATFHQKLVAFKNRLKDSMTRLFSPSKSRKDKPKTTEKAPKQV